MYPPRTPDDISRRATLDGQTFAKRDAPLAAVALLVSVAITIVTLTADGGPVLETSGA